MGVFRKGYRFKLLPNKFLTVRIPKLKENRPKFIVTPKSIPPPNFCRATPLVDTISHRLSPASEAALARHTCNANKLLFPHLMATDLNYIIRKIPAGVGYNLNLTHLDLESPRTTIRRRCERLNLNRRRRTLGTLQYSCKRRSTISTTITTTNIIIAITTTTFIITTTIHMCIVACTHRSSLSSNEYDESEGPMRVIVIDWRILSSHGCRLNLSKLKASGH